MFGSGSNVPAGLASLHNINTLEAVSDAHRIHTDAPTSKSPAVTCHLPFSYYVFRNPLPSFLFGLSSSKCPLPVCRATLPYILEASQRAKRARRAMRTSRLHRQRRRQRHRQTNQQANRHRGRYTSCLQGRRGGPTKTQTLPHASRFLNFIALPVPYQTGFEMWLLSRTRAHSTSP